MDDEPLSLAADVLVAALLELHGIAVPPDDLGAIAALYPSLRRRMERIHAVDCGDGS